MDAKFCDQCGARLVWQPGRDRSRPTCPACGHVVYFNPVVGAGALVETEGRVVLVRRGTGPKEGYWSLPAGYVEADELAEAAAIRETEEETGLQVELDDLLGVYSFGREPQTGVLILYAAHPVGGRLCAGDDAAEVGTFAPLEIPSDEKIAFRTHLQALRDWRRARAVIYRPAAAGDRVAVAQLCRHYDEVQAGCQHYLDNPEQGLILALEQEEVVGLACIAHRTWSHAANIDQVFVRPDYRRWGIGTQLVNHAVAYAREKGLRLLLAQAPVTNPILWVYIKAGFRVSGFVDAYYPPGREGPVTALFLAVDL